MKRIKYTGKTISLAGVNNVADLLAQSDVNEVIGDLNSYKDKIESLVVLCFDRNQKFVMLSNELSFGDMLLLLKAGEWQVMSDAESGNE